MRDLTSQDGIGEALLRRGNRNVQLRPQKLSCHKYGNRERRRYYSHHILLIDKKIFCIRSFVFYPLGEEIRFRKSIEKRIGTREGENENNQKGEENEKIISFHAANQLK